MQPVIRCGSIEIHYPGEDQLLYMQTDVGRYLPKAPATQRRGVASEYFAGMASGYGPQEVLTNRRTLSKLRFATEASPRDARNVRYHFLERQVG